MEGPPFSVEESEIQTLYKPCFEIEKLHEQEVLDKYPRFKEKGLSSLAEKVYLLKGTPKN